MGIICTHYKIKLKQIIINEPIVYEVSVHELITKPRTITEYDTPASGNPNPTKQLVYMYFKQELQQSWAKPGVFMFSNSKSLKVCQEN
jgi:hypothetical protein